MQRILKLAAICCGLDAVDAEMREVELEVDVEVLNPKNKLTTIIVQDEQSGLRILFEMAVPVLKGFCVELKMLMLFKNCGRHSVPALSRTQLARKKP